MAKQKKRTIKFLRAAAKSTTKSGGDQKRPPNKQGRKKPRIRKEDRLVEDAEFERVIPMDKMENDEMGEDSDSDEPKAKKGSVGRHKDELQGLREKDPEFFKYLQENDANLLSFGDDDEDEEDLDLDLNEEEGDEDDNEEDDEQGEEDEEEEHNRGRRKKHRKDVVEVTADILDDTIKRAQSGSLFSLKRLLAIFRAACSPTADNEGDEEEEKGTNTFLIPSPEVYQLTMVGVADHAHAAIYKQLDIKELNVETISKLGDHPKWKKVQFLVLSFFKSILHLLSSLSVASKQGQVSAFVITSLEAYLPLLAPMPRLTKAVMNTLLTMWSSGSAPGEDEAGVRAQAFLRVRQMALILPGAVREECFRSIYLRYARICKNYSETTASSVNFMSQSIAELYRSDPVLAYQQAFLYIRQLALHLRAALAKKSAESTRVVTSWQFLNCLRLWTKIVCSMPEEDKLGPLIFPMSQVMFGVMAAAPSIYFVPLRFHLITCLHQLAAHGKVFIPTAARLAEIIEHPDMTSKPAPSTEVPPRMQYLVRLPDNSLNKVPVRDLVVAEVISLLRNDIEIYRYHVGVPEYAYLTIKKLRAFGKKTKVSKWRDLCRTLAGQMDDYSANAKRERVKLGKAPMQIREFEPLLPVGAPVAAARLTKLLTEKAALIPKEVTVSAYASQAQGGDERNRSKGDAKKKQAGKRDDSDEEEEEEEDDEEDEDEDEEEDEEDSEEEDDVSEDDDGGDDDKVGDLQWSDFED